MMSRCRVTGLGRQGIRRGHGQSLQPVSERRTASRPCLATAKVIAGLEECAEELEYFVGGAEAAEVALAWAQDEFGVGQVRNCRSGGGE